MLTKLIECDDSWYCFHVGLAVHVCKWWLRNNLELPEHVSDLWIETSETQRRGWFAIKPCSHLDILVDGKLIYAGVTLAAAVTTLGPCWVRFWYKEEL